MLPDRAATCVTLVHDGAMSALEFAASQVASLCWPAVILGAMIIFRQPLSELIGRIIKTYKSWGQEVTFGERLAAAESSVEEALKTSKANIGQTERLEAIEPSPLVREAEQIRHL